MLESEILGAYEAHDEGQEGEHIITKIPRAVPPAARRHAAPRTARFPRRAGAGTELVDEAAGRPPSRPGHRRRVAGASCAAIGSAGLVPAALRLLVAAGHGDPTR